MQPSCSDTASARPQGGCVSSVTGGASSPPQAKSTTVKLTLVTVVGAGEDEANGVYVECTSRYSDKPQFVKNIEGTATQSPGRAVLWYASSGNVWCIRRGNNQTLLHQHDRTSRAGPAPWMAGLCLQKRTSGEWEQRPSPATPLPRLRRYNSKIRIRVDSMWHIIKVYLIIPIRATCPLLGFPTKLHNRVFFEY